MSPPPNASFNAATADLRPGVSLIEANAGTGKTHQLTHLVARLVARESVPLERILVVTYTEAATGELRQRLRDVLRDTARTADPAEAQRCREALGLFDRAAVHTIHGFCQRMLREFGHEAGVPADAEILTDPTPLSAEVVREFFARQIDHPATP
ncbi:MAG: exodeoxyribonuclease V subunit beta, partial [Puniceicoccaceae bacterium]